MANLGRLTTRLGNFVNPAPPSVIVIPAIVPLTMSAKPNPAVALVSVIAGLTRTETNPNPLPGFSIIAVLTLYLTKNSALVP